MGKGRSGQHGMGHNLCLVNKPKKEGERVWRSQDLGPRAGLFLVRVEEPLPLGIACFPGFGPAGSSGQGTSLAATLESHLAHLLPPAPALKRG